MEEELKQLFNYFDKDGSGKISVSELEGVMVALGKKMTEAEVVAIMTSADINGDKHLDLDEFKKFFEKYPTERQQISRELKSAFRKFDQNGNGFVDKKELMSTLTDSGAFSLNENEAEYLLKSFDHNKDGQIDFMEFVHLISGIFPTIEKIQQFNRRS